ncbi:MAG: hypothetical protein ACT4OK_14945 [Gemmobacter sp.]
MRLLLDTNVLLLFIAGSVKMQAVGTKRLQAFDLYDFDIVARLALESSDHISTPHVFAEVSNFLGSGRQQFVEGGTVALAKYIAVLNEIHVPARQVAINPEFHALGLTDAAIHYLAGSDTRVVSVDFHPCNRLAAKGIDAINPRNLRAT